MVFVAIRPKSPAGLTKLNARRKKCATRSAFPWDSTWIVFSQSRYPARLLLIKLFLPANGGLPTMASKPLLSRAKTSGNSISQWKGSMDCSPDRRDFTLSASGSSRTGVRPALTQADSLPNSSSRLFSRARSVISEKKAEIAASPTNRTNVSASSASARCCCKRRYGVPSAFSSILRRYSVARSTRLRIKSSLSARCASGFQWNRRSARATARPANRRTAGRGRET